MIRLDVPQGGAEWIAARLGLPTASQFHRILTPKTLKPSEQAVGYLHELLAEWLLGEPVSPEVSQFMERGQELEEQAVAWYEMQHDVTVDRVGFCLLDDRRAGCSPDGLIGTDGGLEIKCPSAAVHVGHLLDVDAGRYTLQIQGGLWITEREWWDFVSYHPTLPVASLRVHRDERIIAALASAVGAFSARLAEARVALEARGIAPALVA